MARYNKSADDDAATLLSEYKDEHPLCAKCGHDYASILYHEGSRVESVSPARCSAFQVNFDGEHLHLTCSRCGYEWCEKPVDQGK